MKNEQRSAFTKKVRADGTVVFEISQERATEIVDEQLAEGPGNRGAGFTTYEVQGGLIRRSILNNRARR